MTTPPTLSILRFRLFDIEISTEQKIIDEQIKSDNKKKLKEAIKLLTNRQREAIYCLYYEGPQLRGDKGIDGIH